MDLDVVALVVEQPHQRRVRDRDVVALEVVLDDDLPVRRLDVATLAEALEAGQVVAREALGQAAETLAQRRGARVEVDEDQAAEHLGADLVQAEAGLVEVGDSRPSGTPMRRPSSR